jgi:hypothetical protein
VTYIALYAVGGLLVQTIGPLPYTLAECEAYAVARYSFTQPRFSFRCMQPHRKLNLVRPSA